MEENRSKALDICALVFGILGIVGCICYGIFGLIGLILSIVCMATGRKSGLSIAGLICSIVGLLASIGIYGYTFYMMANDPNFQSIVNQAMQQQ